MIKCPVCESEFIDIDENNECQCMDCLTEFDQQEEDEYDYS